MTNLPAPEQPQHYSYASREPDLRSAITKAAADTNANPSEPQKLTGNYRKGQFHWNGWTIAIENPAGSTRRGRNSMGIEWQQKMPVHYGYIRRTESRADGDHIDVFVGPDPESPVVFVVDQSKPGNGHFDEHKVMIGFMSEKAAKDAYLASYHADWPGFRSIHALTIQQFQSWVDEGQSGEAIAGQVSKYEKRFVEQEHPRASDGEFSKGAGSKTTATKKAPGSQMVAEHRDRMRSLGMTGTFPPADVPLSAIKMAPEGATPEEMKHKAIMQWDQTTKSGRVSRQYRYTQDFHDRNAADKFDRVMRVEPYLKTAVATLQSTMANPALPTRLRDGAAIASIIAETGLRPTDGDDSVTHGHYGIASLLASHVKFVGNEAHLDFIGKEGVRNQTIVRDPQNVAYLASKQAGKSASDTLWDGGSDSAASQLKSAVQAAGGPADVKLKDLRTIRATNAARTAVAKFPGPPPPLSHNVTKDAKMVASAILSMSSEVATILNNTPTQARDNYIHPEIFKAWLSKLRST